ncbi:hypothetical protein M2419_000866 [Sphingobacterium sp. BIGb0116]|nr:hypothetical protein [Sphingobacterium sp. BIGb0116]
MQGYFKMKYEYPKISVSFQQGYYPTKRSIGHSFTKVYSQPTLYIWAT